MLINALGCVLSGLSALSNMSKVFGILALNSGRLSNCFRPCWGLWDRKGRIFLFKYLRILLKSEQLAT
jgi:hypothetical protein